VEGVVQTLQLNEGAPDEMVLPHMSFKISRFVGWKSVVLNKLTIHNTLVLPRERKSTKIEVKCHKYFEGVRVTFVEEFQF
jgi:hypothetical protein